MSTYAIRRPRSAGPVILRRLTRPDSQRSDLLPRLPAQRRLRAFVLVLVLALALVLGIGPIPSGHGPLALPAAAVEDESPTLVEITSMTPQIAYEDDIVSLAGTITNVSDEPLGSAQAYLWRDTGLVTSSEQLVEVRGYPATSPEGARYLPSMQELDPEGTDPLEPGETIRFRVEAPLDELGIPAADGAALVGVHVRAQSADGYQTVGRDRIWLPRRTPSTEQAALGTGDPMPVSSVVMLASTPSRISAQTFLDDHLASETAEGGRLEELLTTAEQDGRSVLVDPALVTELADMADGYRVLTRTPGSGTDDASTEPEPSPDASAAPPGTAQGTGQAQAHAWLARLQALVEDDSSDAHRLPYAVADPNLLASQHQVSLWTEATSAQTLPSWLADLPLVAAPADQRLSPAALDMIDTNSTTDVPEVVLATNVEAEPAVTYALEGNDTPLLTPFDTDAFAYGPAPEPRDSPLQIRQSMEAATTVARAEDAPAQVRLLTDAAQARADREDRRTRTPLSRLVQEAEPAPLTEDQLGEVTLEANAQRLEVTRAITDRRELDTMTEDVGAGLDLTTRPVLALASATWQRHPETFRAYATAEEADVERLLEGDALSVTARSVILTARESTQFPVTVTNELSVPVTVRLAFQSEHNDRLHVPDIPDLALGAGEAVTVSVTPEVEANGRYTVLAQLETPSGRPLGAPTEIDVQATQAGRVGWVLMIVSGLVVVGTTVLRVRQVRQERSTA